ncbi:hypothetical protein IW492_03070 [Enterococcus sp. BWB1-3]|uniref:hypothetical protein n=1 Tax=Enterococcus sp. BWB1-3 TaxID=2787713 RepID=UPI001921230A|nr:hypothetical protein [Enterococcus sp. BWB1-3]MBL1228214.1 hypothetical protein [Enterococcus sp. BWB1-3]
MKKRITLVSFVFLMLLVGCGNKGSSDSATSSSTVYLDENNGFYVYAEDLLKVTQKKTEEKAMNLERDGIDYQLIFSKENEDATKIDLYYEPIEK